MTEKKSISKNGDNSCLDFLISPVFKLSPDVELREIPSNGEEYLLKVMKERASCAVITQCKQDYSKFAKNQSCYVKEPPRLMAPENMKPTIEWQNIQVADFSDVRMYVSRMRMLVKKSNWSKKVKRLRIPTNKTGHWRNLFVVREPTLSCVIAIRQSMLDEGLEKLIKMLGDIPRGHSIDHKTGQWIYSFLACTRQPLLSDTVSILRNLARRCIEIRARVDPQGENARDAVTPLNIFICLIARYFSQYDLAD